MLRNLSNQTSNRIIKETGVRSDAAADADRPYNARGGALLIIDSIFFVS